METVLFIIQLLEATTNKIIKGRIHLQKLVYFCKAFGVDVDANYKLYIYGPYSQQVANALQDCVTDDILEEAEGEIRKGKAFAKYYREKIENRNKKLPSEDHAIVKKVLSLFGDIPTKQIEIDATTFFIQRQQVALYGSNDKEAVIKKVTEAKHTRFKNEEILAAYNRVQRVQNEYLKNLPYTQS